MSDRNYREIEDSNGGQRVEVTEGQWLGFSFAIHEHPGGVVLLSCRETGSAVALPPEVLAWAAEQLQRIADRSAR